jgi:hypothetical protein
MEVHHHPDLHHKKKKWREYLIEFVMIFIAVLMGFFAENIRETNSDNEKAKAYAQLLYNDIKRDSSNLNAILIIKNWRGLRLDSLISLLKNNNLEENGKMIYYFQSCLKVNIPFRPNDATIQQLTNSGGLRYFKNIKLYNEIIQYYSSCKFYADRDRERTVPTPSNLIAKLFESAFIIADGKPTPRLMDAPQIPGGNPQLLTLDKQVLNEYLLYVGTEREANSLSLSILKFEVEMKVKEVLTALRNEFDLN